MRISGIQQFTTLDYPGRIACILFTAGCNFRCGYCHNPEFVLPEYIEKIKDSFIPEETVFRFLEERQGLLDGVVVSGGEPTVMGDLTEFLEQIQEREFLVKLDTNGSRPDVLRRLFAAKAVDYIAMDVKTAVPEYKKLVKRHAVGAEIVRSMNCIRGSGIPFEFRTTLIREIHSSDVLQKMSQLFQKTDIIFLQPFRPTHTLDPVFSKYHPFSNTEIEAARVLFLEYAGAVYIRPL